MAKSESACRRGATPVAGGTKAAPARTRRTPARQAARQRNGSGAAPAKRVAPPRDRFHAVWGNGQLLALLGALGCGAALAYLLSAGSWQVRQIDLDGAALTSPEAITAALGVGGHNIFTVEPQGAAERLLALPTVREAEVWGELPARLMVRIVERQPALVWQRGDGRFVLDPSGFVLAEGSAAAFQQDLPSVNARAGDPPLVGGRIDPGLVRAALTIGRRAPELGVTIADIEYDPTGGFTLITPGGAGMATGRRILIGDDTRLAEKLAVAGEIIRAEQSWTVVNITDPDRPFFPPQQP